MLLIQILMLMKPARQMLQMAMTSVMVGNSRSMTNSCRYYYVYFVPCIYDDDDDERTKAVLHFNCGNKIILGPTAYMYVKLCNANLEKAVLGMMAGLRHQGDQRRLCLNDLTDLLAKLL